MNNLSSYCGLVDAKIRASDKDLPVCLLNEGIGFVISSPSVNISCFFSGMVTN